MIFPGDVDDAVDVFGGDEVEEFVDEGSVGVEDADAVSFWDVVKDHGEHGGAFAHTGAALDVDAAEAQVFGEVDGFVFSGDVGGTNGGAFF